MKLTIGQRIQAAGFAYGRALMDPDMGPDAESDAWCRLLRRASEVDHLLTRIREAVAAEREAADARVRSPHPRPNRCGFCGWSLYDGVAGQNPGCVCAGRELADAEKGWRTPDQLSQCNDLDALLSGEG